MSLDPTQSETPEKECNPTRPAGASSILVRWRRDRSQTVLRNSSANCGHDPPSGPTAEPAPVDTYRKSATCGFSIPTRNTTRAPVECEVVAGASAAGPATTSHSTGGWGVREGRAGAEGQGLEEDGAAGY